MVKYNDTIAYDLTWFYDDGRTVAQILGTDVGAAPPKRKIKHVDFRNPWHEPPGYDDVIGAKESGQGLTQPSETQLLEDSVVAEYAKKQVRNNKAITTMMMMDL